MMDLDRIEEIIAEVEIGFFITRNENRNHGRPMATLALDTSASLWFLVHSESDLAREISNDPNVSISYNDIYSNKFLLLNGEAFLIADAEKKEELWHPKLTKWIPNGPQDPGLVLLRVFIKSSECWNPALGKMEDQFNDSEVFPLQVIHRKTEQIPEKGVNIKK